jgi:hypothetical protein
MMDASVMSPTATTCIPIEIISKRTDIEDEIP